MESCTVDIEVGTRLGYTLSVSLDPGTGASLVTGMGCSEWQAGQDGVVPTCAVALLEQSTDPAHPQSGSSNPTVGAGIDACSRACVV
eukprot:3995464-Prorocentrum_lima.AAC.1